MVAALILLGEDPTENRTVGTSPREQQPCSYICRDPLFAPGGPLTKT